MSQKSSHGHNPMTSQAAARIQSATAKANDGQVAKGSFAAKSQSTAAHDVNKGGSKK